MLRTSRIAALVALSATAAAAGNRSARLTVGATVISSLRLHVAPSPVDSATAESPASAVRSVPVHGGVYRVTSLRFGAAAYGGSWSASLRTAQSGGPAVRYAVGAGGAWDRKGFGVPVPAGADLAVQVGDGSQTLELGVFQPDTGRIAAERYVVLTVMVDDVPPRSLNVRN